MTLSLIVLAAGRSTRMKSRRSKVLHELAGLPILGHVLQAGRALKPDRIVVVASREAEEVALFAQDMDPEIEIAWQEAPRGTADAVRTATDHLADQPGDVLVLCGDVPLVQPETLEALRAARADHDLVFLGMEPDDPAGYGRMILDGDRLAAIVEHKDADDAQRRISLCNAGLLAGPVQLIADLVAEVSDGNAAAERYLTDIVALARARGATAGVVTCPALEATGVNTRVDLAAAERAWQDRARAAALDAGASLVSPETVFFSHDTLVGHDALIEPNVVFGPNVVIEAGAHVRAFSHLEGCVVSQGAVVGPFARIRPSTEIRENCRVGNFVEVKNALLEEDVKLGHLSYVGDAVVGAGTNVGAGTITCNYDGVFKHRTEIGPRAFIGSGTMLVAPVSVGEEAMTAAGSVITADVEDGALGIGRTRQVIRQGFAHRFISRLREEKERIRKGLL